MRRYFRITKNDDFKLIVENGVRFSNSIYNIYSIHNELDHPRFGVSVSKKRGNAVVRNKIRRQIKSILMAKISLVSPTLDYVIVVKDGYLGQSFLENEKSLVQLFEKLNKELLNGTNFDKRKKANR